jgi:hypothetical protein
MVALVIGVLYLLLANRAELDDLRKELQSRLAARD